MVVSPETMGMLISVRGKSTNWFAVTRKCTLPSCENTALLQEKQPRIHFSWKVNIFCHSIIIAQVSCCFRLTSPCAHRATQPDLSYLCTQGRGKNSFFFPLGSAVILDFSLFMSMLSCAVIVLLWQLHLYFSLMTGLKHMMLWPQIYIVLKLKHHSIHPFLSL